MSSAPERDELLARLHRLRSTLARVKSELELAQLEGERLAGAMVGLSESFRALESIEQAALGRVSNARLAVASGAHRADGRVFVVDDDRRLAELTCRQLARYGYECAAREDVFEAVMEADSRDAFVVDLGLAVAADAELRGRLSQFRLVIISGAVREDEKQIASEFNAQAFFVKPVETALLAQALSQKPPEGPL